MGFAANVRRLLAASVRLASARMRLFSLEAREASGHLAKMLVLWGALFLLLMCGWLFLCIGVLFFIAEPMGCGWLWAALIMAGLHFITAVILGIVLKRWSTRPLFALTAEEMRKDRQWVEQEKEPK